ncbi:TetR/AcrR family transcriptional regulator [Pseudoneobacillus sp. C159]
MKREQNKAMTKNMLMTAAMELFKIQEYQKTTIDEIVKKAGVSKPTFFAYFKSKEQILYEFDVNQLETFRMSMKEQMDQQDKDIFNNLKNSIINMATVLHTTPMFTQNMMHLLTINEEYKELLRKMFGLFQSITEEVIQYGQQHAMVTTNISPETIAKDINTIYIGSLVTWVISNGTDSLQELLNEALDHYLLGILISGE